MIPKLTKLPNLTSALKTLRNSARPPGQKLTSCPPKLTSGTAQRSDSCPPAPGTPGTRATQRARAMGAAAMSALPLHRGGAARRRRDHAPGRSAPAVRSRAAAREPPPGASGSQGGGDRSSAARTRARARGACKDHRRCARSSEVVAWTDGVARLRDHATAPHLSRACLAAADPGCRAVPGRTGRRRRRRSAGRAGSCSAAIAARHGAGSTAWAWCCCCTATAGRPDRNGGGDPHA